MTARLRVLHFARHLCSLMGRFTTMVKLPKAAFASCRRSEPLQAACLCL